VRCHVFGVDGQRSFDPLPRGGSVGLGTLCAVQDRGDDGMKDRVCCRVSVVAAPPVQNVAYLFQHLLGVAVLGVAHTASTWSHLTTV
jgi:hypothetical protein